MSTAASVALKFKALANDLNGAGMKTLVNRVAKLAKDDILREVEKDVGGDRKMSGWKPKFNARYDLTGEGQATLKGTPTGPWKVLEDGRKAGTQLPKKKKRKVYQTPQGLRTATKEAPFIIGATKGKHTFAHAKTVIQSKTPKRIHEETRAIISKHF